MNNNIKVSASVLNADLSDLRSAVAQVEAAGVSHLHIDVMDGIFVPPLTIGDVVVKSLRGKTSLIFDTHLMVRRPTVKMIDNFAEAGSDYITVHAESEYTETDIRTMLGLIKSTGCKAGLAINPPTPADAVFPYVDVADMIVVMSVNPGYGGQSFIHGSIDKIAAIRKHADSLGVNPLIEVDGGINAQTAPNAVKAGADILVAGTYLFGAPDMREAADSLMRL